MEIHPNNIEWKILVFQGTKLQSNVRGVFPKMLVVFGRTPMQTNTKYNKYLRFIGSALRFLGSALSEYKWLGQIGQSRIMKEIIIK